MILVLSIPGVLLSSSERTSRTGTRLSPIKGHESGKGKNDHDNAAGRTTLYPGVLRFGNKMSQPSSKVHARCSLWPLMNAERPPCVHNSVLYRCQLRNCVDTVPALRDGGPVQRTKDCTVPCPRELYRPKTVSCVKITPLPALSTGPQLPAARPVQSRRGLQRSAVPAPWLTQPPADGGPSANSHVHARPFQLSIIRGKTCTFGLYTQCCTLQRGLAAPARRFSIDRTSTVLTRP